MVLDGSIEDGPKISTLIICGDDRNSGEAEQVSLYQFPELSLHRSPLLWSWGEGHDCGVVGTQFKLLVV